MKKEKKEEKKGDIENKKKYNSMEKNKRNQMAGRKTKKEKQINKGKV